MISYILNGIKGHLSLLLHPWKQYYMYLHVSKYMYLIVDEMAVCLKFIIIFYHCTFYV